MGLSEKSGSPFYVLKKGGKNSEKWSLRCQNGARLEKFCYYEQKLDNLDIKKWYF